MKTKILVDFQICISVSLSANRTKWSNTLKQFVGNSLTYFSPMFYFYTLWKRHKTSAGREMENLAKMV